jgi:hypothetical protein
LQMKEHNRLYSIIYSEFTFYKLYFTLLIGLGFNTSMRRRFSQQRA